MGQGPQNNENAAEQFQDEQISDAIRRLVMSGTSYNTNVADFDGRAKNSAYKSTTGQEFFVKDKEH